VSDRAYSIHIDELVVDHGAANVDDLTREVEVELRRLLAGPADARPTRSETNAQRIARTIHAKLQDGRPR
jgi:hypothetical protein